MSELNRSMGLVLRYLGHGAVTVTLRQKDFNVVQVEGPKGPMAAPADTLLSFNATSYREMPSQTGEVLLPAERHSDIWEFRIPEQSPAGMVSSLLYIHGCDILVVKAAAKVL